MIDILRKIETYTSPTMDTLTETSTALFKEIDNMERIIRSIPDNSMRASLMSNLDRARMFLLDNLDIFNEKMDGI